MEPPWSSGGGALLSAWRAAVLLLQLSALCSVGLATRHAVYWNSTDTRLTGGKLSIQVKLNDYLDIFCPHYPSRAPHPSPHYPSRAPHLSPHHPTGAPHPAPHHPAKAPHPSRNTTHAALVPEVMALYLVEEQGFQGCVETAGATKRWECNVPYAELGPMRFSERIQRFTPFSLGFEFQPGQTYYYSSLPIEGGPGLPCMRLRVFVLSDPSKEELKQTQVTPASRSSAGSLGSLRSGLLLLFLLLAVA